MSKGWPYWTLILFIAAGCDCMSHVQCRVVDDTTGTPIPDVKVVGHFISDNTTRTDSTGTFELSGIVGHLRCPRMRVTLSAPGYETSELRLRSGDEIRMVPAAR